MLVVRVVVNGTYSCFGPGVLRVYRGHHRKLNKDNLYDKDSPDTYE